MMNVGRKHLKENENITFFIQLASIFNTKLCFFHTFHTELSPFHQTSKNLNIQHEYVCSYYMYFFSFDMGISH